MRTALTIDDDVAAALERMRGDRNASLKDLVNEALRRGLKDMTEHVPTLCSTDGDFARFPGLRWLNPLAR